VSDHAFSTATPATGTRQDPVARLRAGVRHLRASGRLHLDQRLLLVIGGTVAPLGVILVVLGWHGAAHTPNLFEQIPYLISGGLLGVALVFLGAFLYFTHWLTDLVKEHRAQSAAVVEAIRAVESVLARLPAATPSSGTALVATAKGTMAHRPDCIVVAGIPRAGLRRVTPSDPLAPCELCHPPTQP
jgi:hypothetical protein